MTREITLPPLGENVEAGLVVTLRVAPGDHVEAGDSLLEIETDKVTMEVPAETDGVIDTLHVAEGDRVAVGEPIVVLRPADGASTLPEADQEAPADESLAEPPADMPDEEAAVVDKGSNAAGSDPSRPPALAGPPANGESGPLVENAPPERDVVLASPLARKVAREWGVPLNQVSSRAKSGRVSVQDVKAYVRGRGGRTEAGGATRRPLPDFSEYGPVRRETLKPIAAATSQNMAQTWSQIPHAWLEEQVDITTLETHRQRHKDRVAEAGGALTLTALLVKVAAQALRSFPRLNASLDVEAKEIVYKDYVHVGVAVDTERGLLVPVLRNADQKSLTEIAGDLSELSAAAREGATAPDDLQGATFTISNLGGIGLTRITPLVNWPQVAILGAAAYQMEQRYVDGAFEPRRMLPLTLGFDHRIINGADGARFMQFIKERLEDPFLMNL